METTGDIQNVSAEGKEKQRKRVIKITLALAGVMVTIEVSALLYIIYTLGLYHDDRWKTVFIYDVIFGVPIILLVGIFGVKWAKDGIEFGRVLLSGRQPSIELTIRSAQSVFLFARNCALLFLGLYLLLLIPHTYVCGKWYGFTRIDLITFATFKGVTSFNMAVLFYYAIKIAERTRLEQAVERLFGEGIYEWPHFRLSIRYKIFLLIFTVGAYLLCSSVMMGFTRADNARYNRLKEDVEYWAEKVAGKPGDMRNVDTKLSAHAALALLGKNGSVLAGDASIFSDDEIRLILSDADGGELTDYKKKKLVRYLPSDDGNFVAVITGRWDSMGESGHMGRNFTLALLVVTLFLSVVTTFVIVNDINEPLTNVLEFLRSLSGGDTRIGLSAYSEDELGDFSRELARTTTLLENKTKRANELVGGIEKVTSEIEKSVVSVRSAASEQAAGIEEQAAAVEEALSAATEIVSTSRQIAENSGHVKHSAEENLLSCNTGSERVAEALDGFRILNRHVEAMSRGMIALEEDIQNITSVVGIIEEVAVQTNLLSLNAQLEAVGAGKGGKRFRVVAEEVRRLADNTIQAVKKISSMIDHTMASTENAARLARKGTELVKKGAESADAIGGTLEEIRQLASSTEDAAGKITITTNQQKTASEQMAATISEIHSTSGQIKSSAYNVLETMKELANTSQALAEVFKNERS